MEASNTNNATTNWSDLTKSLPGFFFINNLHSRIIFHNRTVENYHRKNCPTHNTTNLGASLLDVAIQLNPNHPKLAQDCVEKIYKNNTVVLKERRGLLFEQAFPIMGQCTHVITFKKPIFDSHGYIIGLCGYSFSKNTVDESDRNSITELYQQTRQALIKLNLQAQQADDLINLIEFATAIEASI